MPEPTDIHTPGEQAPNVTNEVALCSVCHTQWQVRSFARTDALMCPFCGTGSEYGGISIISEAPEYGGAVING